MPDMKFRKFWSSHEKMLEKALCCHEDSICRSIHRASGRGRVLCKAGDCGNGCRLGDVTDFYYTYSTSTAPPHYQRYRFYVDGRKYLFYHETREGGGWPQTEKDITESGSRPLSKAEWAEFFECLKGGTVENRKEHLEDGDAGPWLFLYWKGDHGKCQEFSFASPAARFAFEELCARLRKGR